jgi:uncharacterized protein (TIGR02284 family)
MKNKAVKILNELIQINNDRIEGYETAADELNDISHAQIKSLFFSMAEESRDYKEDLLDAVVSLGGEPDKEKSTTNSGKLYRIWMDVKAAFSKDDVKAALESCEFGEDVALKAYQEALETESELPSDISSMLAKQRQELRASHDRIKRLRDDYKTVGDINN